MDDILAISAGLSKRMERVADAGSHLLSAGLHYQHCIGGSNLDNDRVERWSGLG